MSVSAPGTTTQVTMFLRHPVPGWHSIEELFSTIRQHLSADVEVKVVTLSHPSRGVLPRLRNMWEAWRHRGQVNHITGDVHYLALVLPSSRTVLTVHDLGALESMRGMRRWLFETLWFRLPVHRSALITVVSQTTAEALTRLIPQCSDRLSVIENPVHSAFSVSGGNGCDSSGPVLCVGTTENKNLARIFAAIEGTDRSPLIVGRLSTAQEEDLESRGICFENIFDVSQDELVRAYLRSSVLVFPSLSEGFGMPIIEAQALGLPVVTSDREPMRSVAGDGAKFVNPESVDEIREAIQLLADNSGLREKLVMQGLRNLRRFSAPDAAHRYAEVYRNVTQARAHNRVCSN
jgi:glycosyltransferase involved in cell wall biosynthesis